MTLQHQKELSCSWVISTFSNILEKLSKISVNPNPNPVLAKISNPSPIEIRQKSLNPVRKSLNSNPCSSLTSTQRCDKPSGVFIPLPVYHLTAQEQALSYRQCDNRVQTAFTSAQFGQAPIYDTSLLVNIWGERLARNRGSCETFRLFAAPHLHSHRHILAVVAIYSRCRSKLLQRPLTKK